MYREKSVADYFSRIPKYTNLVAKCLATCMIQSTLDLVYIVTYMRKLITLAIKLKIVPYLIMSLINPMEIFLLIG